MPYVNKLSEEQFAKLLVDYEDGFGIAELALRYGVSVSTVGRYLSDAGRKRYYKTRQTRQVRRREKNPVQLQPCGTAAAYRRHKRNKEYPCIPCSDAYNKEARARKQRKKAS